MHTNVRHILCLCSVHTHIYPSTLPISDPASCNQFHHIIFAYFALSFLSTSASFESPLSRIFASRHVVPICFLWYQLTQQWNNSSRTISECQTTKTDFISLNSTFHQAVSSLSSIDATWPSFGQWISKIWFWIFLVQCSSVEQEGKAGKETVPPGAAGAGPVFSPLHATIMHLVPHVSTL